MSLEDIQGSGIPRKITPEEKKMYEQEYRHGADLFQRALQEYSKSDNMYQKEEFKEVMDKAMQVLNETARELKQKELDKQNQLIAKDYSTYQNNPTDQLKQKLSADLDKAKKSIG